MEKYTGINTGKICSVEMINVANIDDMVIDLEQQKAWLTLRAGADFTPIIIVDETAQLQMQPEGNDDGSTDVHRVSLTFKVPKINASRGMQLEQWRRQAFVARITDVNGQKLLIGTLASYARLVYEGVIGGLPTDENLYQVTIIAATTTGLLQQQENV